MSLLLLISLFVAVIAQNCDKLGVAVYEDMGCKPIFHGKTACPAKYYCVGITSSNSCIFKGQSIPIGESANASLAPPCMFGCFCQEDKTFACPIVDCAPYVYNYQPSKPECYREASLTECCYFKELCPKNNITFKCNVDGNTYREGEKFSPKNTCWDCICRKGWRGVNEPPFCQRRNCGVQLHNQQNIQNSCAPVYFYRDTPDNTLCCPSSWVCPEPCDKIKGEPQGLNLCKFGTKSLRVGQWIDKYIEIWSTPRIHVRCNCVVPPLLTCTEVLKS